MSSDIDLMQKLREHVSRDSAVELLQGAVARQSITGNEANFVDFLEGRMATLNLQPQRAEFQPGRPNIWGERRGAG